MLDTFNNYLMDINEYIYRKYSIDYDCDIKCKLCLQNDIGDEYHYPISYFLFLFIILYCFRTCVGLALFIILSFFSFFYIGELRNRTYVLMHWSFNGIIY